jgi:hypothetical protein
MSGGIADGEAVEGLVEKPAPIGEQPAGKTVVELRVHGVSGTPPEAMLNCPSEFLHRESGDDRAAFYRRADWIDNTISPPKPGKWRRLIEVYSWGGLTSGPASRALWLLFLPFTLVNLAHWMLPPAANRRPAVVVVALLRLLALSFTLTLLLAMAVAIMDVAAWQCGSHDFCSAGWGPLAFLQKQGTGARLAWSAVPLLVVILALWRLGSEEPQCGPSKELPPDAVVEHGSFSPLAELNFWNHDPAVKRMRACHVTAWTAALGALLLAAPVKQGYPGLVGAVNSSLLTVHLVFLAIVVVATSLTPMTGRGGDAPRWGWAPPALMGLRWVALVLLAASLFWVGFTADISEVPAGSTLPGLYPAVDWLAGVQAGLLLAIFIGTALATGLRSVKATRGGEHYRPTLLGFTGPFVALVGWLLGGGVSVGFGLWTGQILGTLTYSADDAESAFTSRENVLGDPAAEFGARVNAVKQPAKLVVPLPYMWTAAALVLLILATAVIGLYLWIVIRRQRTKRMLEELRASTSSAEAEAPDDVVKRIAKSRAVASLTDLAPRVIAVVALFGAGLLGAIILLYGRFPGWPVWRYTTTAFIAGAPVSLVITLVVLVFYAVRNRQVRRLVGILWDVATFWPRATHPLTPPSYGGHTVWDLKVRMDALVRERMDPTTNGQKAENQIILVAHSQGTIIAAATLLQCKLSHEMYPLMTFGSPLRRLYARNFPAYFGRGMLEALQDRVPWSPRWVNLWAQSDPIGSWVLDELPVYAPGGAATFAVADALATVDCRILDVAQQNPDLEKYTVCPDGMICGHSDFWHRREYDKVLDALQSIVAPAVVDTEAAVAPKRGAV